MTLSRPQPWRARGPAFATRVGSRRRGWPSEPQQAPWHGEFVMGSTVATDVAPMRGELALELGLNLPDVAAVALTTGDMRVVQALLCLPTGQAPVKARLRSA